MKKNKSNLSEKELDEFFKKLEKGISNTLTAEEARKCGLTKSSSEKTISEKSYSEIEEEFGDDISDEEWENELLKIKEDLGGHW